MFETRVTKILGIRYPVIQGAMLYAARAELVSAVSNAGGLGIIVAFTFTTPEEFAAELRKIKKLTDKPFAVNIPLIPAVGKVNYDVYINVIIDDGVKIVETAAGNPEPYMARLKSAGIKVIHKCTGLRFAQKAENIGCDMVVLDGFECAGFTGEDDVTSLTLVPVSTKALNIPVIAAGGFGDGRGLVAALALGADAVYMGTRFLMTREASVHIKMKEYLLKATERDTTILCRRYRSSRRLLRNAYSDRVAKMEMDGATAEELASLTILTRNEKYWDIGDVDEAGLPAGQVIGLIDDIPSAGEVIERIIKEAEEIISGRLQALVQK